MTFKNPKTIQMFNIMVLYHYVMSFIVGIVVFTFVFAVSAMFRHYFYFNYKLNLVPSFGRNMIWRSVWDRFVADPTLYLDFIFNVCEWFATLMLLKKREYMKWYMQDIRAYRTSLVHHAPIIEFIWIWIPALILVCIAYPSVIMLYLNETYIDPVITITIVGNQWYWTYEYNDYNLIELFKKHVNSEHSSLIKAINNCLRNVLALEDKTFPWLRNSGFSSRSFIRNIDAALYDEIPSRYTVDCNMIIAKDPKFPRLLTTDWCLVIPSQTPIRFLVTSNDVIHSWAVPSYGVKMDAVPGRLNQLIFSVPLMGTSWGQCSELCGVNHAYMPIEVKVLAFGDFLYFIQLRVREILMPFLHIYYEARLKVLKDWFTSEKLLYVFGRTSAVEALKAVKTFLRTSGFNHLEEVYNTKFKK